jgi:hypothetical protein
MLTDVGLLYFICKGALTWVEEPPRFPFLSIQAPAQVAAANTTPCTYQKQKQKQKQK